MDTPQLLADLESACGVEPSLICDLVHGWTDSDVAANLAEWLVAKPLTVLIVLFVAWILTKIAKRAVNRGIQRLIDSRNDPEEMDSIAMRVRELLPDKATDKLEEFKVANERADQRTTTLGAVLRSLVSGVIWLMAGLISLGELGISLGPLIAGAGIAGIAIGFGAQSLVRDFLSGIFIIIEDQYGVGDVIELGAVTGTVEAVTLRTTRLRDVEGALWVVPNGEIRSVGNKSQLWSRSILDIGVAYDSDIDEVSEILKRVADELWHEQRDGETIIEEPRVLGVQELGADAVAIRLMVTTDPAEQWATSRLLRGRIKKALDEAGVEIPFPQRTVWVKNDG